MEDCNAGRAVRGRTSKLWRFRGETRPEAQRASPGWRANAPSDT